MMLQQVFRVAKVPPDVWIVHTASGRRKHDCDQEHGQHDQEGSSLVESPV